MSHGTPEEAGGTFDEAAVRRLAEALRTMDGALMPILRAVQERDGYVDRRAIPIIADVLNLTRAEVHGVASFYHDFRDHPPGAHVVRICRAEACQAMGGRATETHAKARLGIDFDATTADRKITLTPVYCLGNCACSPSMMVDGKIYGRVDAGRFDEIVGALRGGI